MEVGVQSKPGACLDVSFCDGANGRGNIPIKNLAAIGSQSVPAETFDCPICAKNLGPKFFCGAGKLGPDGLPAPVEGTAGKPAELCFWYCSPEDGSSQQAQFDHLQGLSMALSFDCRLQCLEGSFRVPPDSITATLGAEFVDFNCDNNPADGDGCEMVLSILVDAVAPFDGRTLPSTAVPLKLACVDLLLPDKAVCGQCFPIRFQDGVNGRFKVPVFNLVATENQSFVAITNDCKACVISLGEPLFQRGDCNFDGEVSISDAADIVSFLFAVGSWKPLPPCLDACDANDDGRVDLADANAVLLYLFRFGRTPPPPGPLIRGPDPTADKIDCKVDTCQ
jgi:hypothetical protein